VRGDGDAQIVILEVCEQHSGSCAATPACDEANLTRLSDPRIEGVGAPTANLCALQLSSTIQDVVEAFQRFDVDHDLEAFGNCQVGEAIE